jgi:hypothetical protein
MLRRWSNVVRRTCVLFALLIAMFSIGIRARTYHLTRKIQAVLAGLEQVQIDKTSEAELLKTVPYLVLDPAPGTTPIRSYRVRIVDSTDRGYYAWTAWVPQFLLDFRQAEPGGINPNKTWNALGFLPKIAYLLGWRYLSFGARFVVLSGTVSSISYELDPDVPLGWPAPNFVVARSMHAIWGRWPVWKPVGSTEEENPSFRFGPVSGQFSWLSAHDGSIGVAYTQDAPRDLVSHVFQLDLTCFWGLRGCDSVQQVVPELWKDRKAIEDAADARLRSKDPCPDRILSGRMRTLLDTDVAVLEVEDSKLVEFRDEGDRAEEAVMNFRLVETIRGEPKGPWTNFPFSEEDSISQRPERRSSEFHRPAQSKAWRSIS